MRRPSRGVCADGGRWRAAAGVSLLLAAGLASTSMSATAGDADCIAMPAIALPQQPNAPTAQRPAAPDAEMMRPISEAELKGLLSALDPVPLKDGEGVGIRGAVEGKSSLATPRFGVVVGDAMTLLSMVHAREALDALPKAKMDRETRRMFEQDLRRVIGCGEDRFAKRGAAGAMKASLELVRKHRTQLEPLLLDKLQPRQARPGGKGGQQ